MPSLLDRIKETTTSSGTGVIDLDGAVAGYRSFSLFGDSNQCYYTIINRSNNEWEVGIGTVGVGTPNQLTRNTILKNSSEGTTALNFAAGTKEVFCDIPASQLGLGRYGGYSTDYLFHATTTGSGIAATYLRLNNASLASVTHAFLHKSQRYNVSVAAFLASFSNSGNYGYLKIYKEATLDDNWVYLRITALTDQVTYVDLTVTVTDSHGSFSADDVLVVSFSPTGPQGAAGAQGPVGVGVPGPAGVAAVNLIDNPVFMWNQLSTAGSGTAVTLADDTYFADRWYALKDGTGTVSTVPAELSPAIGNNLQYGMSFTWPSATGLRFGVAQIIPMDKLIVYDGPVSLSFMHSLVATGANTLRYAILTSSVANSGNQITSDVVADWSSTNYTTSNFFTADTVVLATGSFTSNTGVPVIKEVENITTSLNANLIIFIWTEAAMSVSGTLYLADFCLTKTTEAVSFEYSDPASDFIQCCRFYQKSTPKNLHPAQGSGSVGFGQSWRFDGAAVTNPTIELGFQFPVKMWNTPTLTVYDAAGTAAKVTACGSDGVTATTVSLNEAGAIVSANPTYTGSNSRMGFNWIADANL